jgi:hypothetical protein
MVTVSGYRRRGAHHQAVVAEVTASRRVERHVRAPRSLSTFAVLAVMALSLVPLATPPAPSQAEALAASFHGGTQRVVVGVNAASAVTRDGYSVTKLAPPKPVFRAAPAVGTPDPGTAQSIAAGMVSARGWPSTEFDCLVALWNKESHWNVYSNNASSGAYGIPQALPGSKMASAGADWATNPATQITWGLGYITGRYGTPCGAWSHSQLSGWY